MTGPERRQTPRTTIARHAYINIEPNNGGIVLNVSEGGLCFHSLDAVQRNGTIRFWFTHQNQRIEADGTLAWTDEKQNGGLRFTSLPEEARKKIHDWMGRPKTLLPTPQVEAVTIQQLGSVPTLPGRPADARVGAAGFAMVSPDLKVTAPVSGFSRGLATGLMVSAVVVAVFAFNNYRREFGESLIRMGERFAAKPQAQTPTVSAATTPVLPASQAVSSAPPSVSPAPRMTAATTRPVSAVAAIVSTQPAPHPVEKPEKVLLQPEKLAPQPLADAAKSSPTKVEPAAPIATSATVGTTAGDMASHVPTSPKAAALTAISPAPTLPLPIAAPTPQPMTAATSGPNLSLKPAVAARVEPANQPGIHTEGSGAGNSDTTRQLYFEVGKFKDLFQAHDQTDKLAQLGFPATAVAKGRLWTNSFHVLVGPYPDEEQAKLTHENLVSNGFKPRPFEKGSRNFTILSSLTLNGARTPEGDYTISWESYIGDANVKFMRNNSVVATAGGRWEKRNVKFPNDAYVYRRNIDGSRTLLEIHFGGMRQALVFGKAS